MSHLRLEIKVSLDPRNHYFIVNTGMLRQYVYMCVCRVKEHVVEITAFQYVGRDSR